MSPIRQNIALAVAVGTHTTHPERRRWSRSSNEETVTTVTDGKGNQCSYWPDSSQQHDVGYIHPLPYWSSLDAIHEAENKLLTGDPKQGGSLRYLYAVELYNIVVPLEQQPCRANARQRCQALLTVLGLWKDDEIL